ncbi:IclR family transcriptional regulator [Streptomyces sp. NPDC091279]|uniref:IclR family transcriptional regulator n=1 Tax=unclassified Streptomyces TaxID=2593676 RepID=UPI00380BEAA1
MTTPHTPSVPDRSLVDRTLAVLGVFDRDNRTLTLSDISRRSGLPIATVHRIVGRLHDWGALERGAHGAYSIGLRLWETAVLAPRPELIEAARPHLADLHEQTSAVAGIAILDGKDSVLLLAVSGRWEGAGPAIPPGRRVPLHATSAGLVLLAHASPEVREQICAGPLRAYTSDTLTDGMDLEHRLARIRQDGHAVVLGTLSEDRAGVAAPVYGADGTVVAAVLVVTSAADCRPALLLPRVLATADAVTRSIGVGERQFTEVGA